MKIQLLLLLSVSGLWSAVQRGQCSEQTYKHSEDTQPDGETHTQKRTGEQLQTSGPSMSSSLFISGVDSSSSSSVKPDVSSRISDIFPVPAAPGVCGPSCRDCSSSSSSCSDETLDSSSSSSSACGASEEALYDSQLSFPAAQENISIRESRKPTKEQTRKRSNASRILKEQGSGGTADADPSLPCRDQQIPSFDEWTKIMMEVENEKSQVTQHLSHNLHTPGKKIQQIFTNYASVECGAKILSSNPEAKSTSAILMENMDMYMLNPCNNKIWFIIELCQPIQVKQLDIANFEIFSSNPKDFLVSISDRYPTKKWVKLGTFHARDQRTVQSFPLDEHLFAKYIKVELLSHYRSEHFCPLSLIRVFGTSMMEEYELNSETSDRQTQAQVDHDYDPSAEFEDRSSRNLIGSAKDALFTMVNNIAANVIGGDAETAERPGNFSTKGLNMSESAERPEPPRSAAADGSVAVLEGQLDVSESASVPPEAPDQQWIVTLLPEAEDELDADGSEADRWGTQSLQEYLLQQCSAPLIRPSVTESPVIHTQTPSVPEAHSLLESSLTSRVSAEHLSFRATQALELTGASASDRSDQETMEETQPVSDVMSTASHTDTSGSSPLNDTSTDTPDESLHALLDEHEAGSSSSTETVHPPDGLEMKNRELPDDDSNVDQSSEMDMELQNSSDAPVRSGSQKESVFMRLNNRIKVLEMNMSLSGRYLEQLSQRYRKQVEEMQRAFNKTIIKLQNTSRMAEEQDQRQTDSIQVLQAQLENVTGLVLSLSVSVSRLQQEVSDRQNYILLCLLLGVLLCLLICVNYHQMCESPAIDSQRSCISDREPPEDEQVFLRRRASDPPSLSSLHTTDAGSGQTGGLQQWERCPVSKKRKNKLKPESLIAPSPATVIPQITVGPEGLEARDVMMSDGSSEGSSQADETLFCGIASCTRLCDALPAPKRWTQSSSRPQRGSRRAVERLHQPATRRDPLPSGPAIGTQRSRI